MKSMTDYYKLIETKFNNRIFEGISDGVTVSEKLFDFQQAIVKWALRKGRACVFADCGMGKGQPIGSRVLTPKGFVQIQNLNVGDEVIASDGRSYKVKGVFPKGEIETYRFYYSDGTSCVFDKDHLHIVRTNNDKRLKG